MIDGSQAKIPGANWWGYSRLWRCDTKLSIECASKHQRPHRSLLMSLMLQRTWSWGKTPRGPSMHSFVVWWELLPAHSSLAKHLQQLSSKSHRSPEARTQQHQYFSSLPHQALSFLGKSLKEKERKLIFLRSPVTMQEVKNNPRFLPGQRARNHRLKISYASMQSLLISLTGGKCAHSTRWPFLPYQERHGCHRRDDTDTT